MRYLIFTDPHVSSRAYGFNVINYDGKPGRFVEYASTFLWLAELCDKKNIDRVSMLGDMFESAAGLQFPYFNLAFFGMHGLPRPCSIIDGNHDKFDSVYRVLDPFKVFARVHSVPEGYYDNATGLRTVFVPFQRNVDELYAHLDKLLKPEEETVVFIHQGPQGHVLDQFAYDKNVFDRPHIKKVFGGHYHFKFEEALGDDPMRLVYPGSVISLRFNEQIASKFAVIWDSKTNELEWVENPHSAFFVSLEQAQVLKLKDELEQVAPVSYLRVVLKDKDEQQRVPMSYLAKFKGYVITTGKDDSPQYRLGDVNQNNFNYNNFSALLSETSQSHLSFDLRYDDFRELILQATEEQILIKQTANKVLDEVFQREYTVGMTR
jgi:DNA repair exonuclease SbcCD nuclease subunit